MLNHKWKGKVWWFESLRIIWCLEISKYTQHLMLHQTKLTAVCPHCQNLSYWDLLGEMKIIQNLPTNKRALTACYCQQCSNEIHGGINKFFFFFGLLCVISEDLSPCWSIFVHCAMSRSPAHPEGQKMGLLEHNFTIYPIFFPNSPNAVAGRGFVTALFSQNSTPEPSSINYSSASQLLQT